MNLTTHIFGKCAVAISVFESEMGGVLLITDLESEAGIEIGDELGVIDDIPPNSTMLFFPTLEHAKRVANAMFGFKRFEDVD